MDPVGDFGYANSARWGLKLKATEDKRGNFRCRGSFRKSIACFFLPDFALAVLHSAVPMFAVMKDYEKDLFDGMPRKVGLHV